MTQAELDEHLADVEAVRKNSLDVQITHLAEAVKALLADVVPEAEADR